MRKNYFVWLIAALLMLTPVLGALSPQVFAQSDEADAPVSAADASPVAETETATPTETPTGTAVPTEAPTAPATETLTPASTATATATATATPARVKKQGAAPVAAKLADVKVAIDCLGNPETVTITNTGLVAFKVTEVRYLYRNKWYTKNQSVAGGQTIIYKTGPNASGAGFTSASYWLVDSVGSQDGARVTTDAGQVTTMCAALPAKSADVRVAVDCLGNPETITITNAGQSAFQVTKIRYLYRNKWYTKDQSVKAGQTIVYKTGPNASGSGFTSASYWFVDSVGNKDGARVTTSVGEVTTMCAPLPVKSSDVRVSVDCLGTPETVSILNAGQASFKITKVKYIYKGKWYAKNQTVHPGQTIVYKTGAKAPGSGVISTNYMLVDAAGDSDGVRITTTAGEVSKYCKALTGERWIDVDLSAQTLTAYQGDVRISSSLISSGKDGFETPTGTFYINSRYRYKDMAGCAGDECWYVPDVQFAQYFTYEGHAIHAATWHNDFGILRRSHGCINLPLGYAAWLWDWSTYGTRVYIHY